MHERIDFSKHNKICVIGAPGTGKTFFANVLARHLKRPLISFDELRFAPRRTGGEQVSPALCTRRLNHILKTTPRWVIEGTAWQPWTANAIAEADIVVVVYHCAIRRCFRILWRWIRDNKYHRNLKSTFGLMRISWRYHSDRLPIILARANAHNKHICFVCPTRRDNRRAVWRSCNI